VDQCASASHTFGSPRARSIFEDCPKGHAISVIRSDLTREVQIRTWLDKLGMQVLADEDQRTEP
jgi:hypothetical protein